MGKSEDGISGMGTALMDASQILAEQNSQLDGAGEEEAEEHIIDDSKYSAMNNEDGDNVTVNKT